MKINYHFVSRSLIALLFVVAGIQKITGFTGTSGYVGSLGVPFPVIATILVIIIEVPVALAFAWGYKTCATGMILAGFTALATLLAHRDFSQGQNMIMALKNIAIIGGIVAVITQCNCGKHATTCKECMDGKKH
jgi:putative oxidoreductase